MDFIGLFGTLPKELAVFILAMLPITELRASIPIGILVYDMPALSALLWSVLGDIIPAYLILLLIGPVSQWFYRHFRPVAKLFDWWFDKVHQRFFAKYQKYGPFALALFVAIPLPITGSWTGATAAWLFKIPKRQAAIYITIGVIIAGGLVTLATTGIIKGLSFF